MTQDGNSCERFANKLTICLKNKFQMMTFFGSI